MVYSSSLIIALVLGGVSLAGILYPNDIYQTEGFLQTFVPTDLARLCIGTPILLFSMWLALRGRLVGLLLWPGTLLYILYSSIIYISALPLSWAFMFHLALVLLSFYTLVALIASINGRVVQNQLTGYVPEKLTGGILAALGIPFFFLATGVMVNAIIQQETLPTTEFALQVADFIITPTWILGGILLWQRHSIGYVVGSGLLFQASMLMVSLLIIILTKPILTSDPFVISDFLAVFAFSLICFIPLMRFTRGISTAQNSKHA